MQVVNWASKHEGIWLSAAEGDGELPFTFTR